MILTGAVFHNSVGGIIQFRVSNPVLSQTQISTPSYTGTARGSDRVRSWRLKYSKTVC